MRNPVRSIVLAAVCSFGLNAMARADDPAEIKKHMDRSVSLFEQGKYREAEEQADAALNILQREIPILRGDTFAAGVIGWKGLCRKRQGKLLPALRDFEWALSLFEDGFGPDHAMVGVTLGNIGDTYVDLRKFSEAKKAYERSLQIREKREGADSTIVADLLSRFSVVHREIGDLAAAGTQLRRAIQILEAKHGAEHITLADPLRKLAEVHMDQQKPSLAEPHLLRAVKIVQATRGADDGSLDVFLNAMGNCYKMLNRVDASREAYERCIRISEKNDGPECENVAIVLGNLADLLLTAGQVREAESLCRRDIAIREKLSGPNHPSLIGALQLLASILESQGRYGAAEPLAQRSLDIAQRVHGPTHPETANALERMAGLKANQGQSSAAEALYKKSIEILAKAGDGGARALSRVQHNLARAYRSQRRFAEADAMFERCLKIDEKIYGADHPKIAITLINLATSYHEQKRYKEAGQLHRRCLEINEKQFGPDSIQVAMQLSNLGGALIAAGDAPAAVRNQRRSLQIYEKIAGTETPDYLIGLHNLSVALLADQKPAEAVESIDRRLRGLRPYLLRELPHMSADEQQAFLDIDIVKRFSMAASLAVSLAGDPTTVERTAEWILNGKGVSVEAQALRALFERDLTDPESSRFVAELRQLRARQSALGHQMKSLDSSDGIAERRRQLAERIADLERKLVQRGGSDLKSRQSWYTLDAIRKALPAGSVFVDIVKFEKSIPVSDSPPVSYAAWIVPSHGKVAIVDLGEAPPIDALIKAARDAIAKGVNRIRDVGEAQATRELIAALAPLSEKLLAPMQRHFNGAKNIILSPDGELWLLPWAALPASVDRFLTEEYGLQFVISGRDLIAPRDDRALSRSAPLILADPDFDAPIGGEPVKAIAGVSATGQLGDAPVHFAFGFDGSVVIRLNDATGDVIGRGAWSLDGTRLRFETERSAYEGEWSGRQVAGRRTIKDQPNRAADPWSFAMPSPPPVGATGERSLSQDANAIPPVARLPFTAIEAEIATDKLAQYLGAKPRIETDATATEAVFKTAVRPRIVMLATHGFYLPTQKLIVTDTGAPGAESPGPAKTADGKDRESPLVRCGILLAGCNRRHGLKPGADDGILTGLEIVSTDLRGCELIVLSACETGLGEVMVGEGVAGLRQAFQLAGAESIIASLWQVPDRDTALMMSRFYDAMAKGAAKAEALRSAQKAQIEMRRKRFGAAHPYFWAAFTLTGRSSALAAK